MPTSSPIRAARGVRDILPSERAAWAVVERAAMELARRYGYQEIEVPILEPAELIERGVGSDSDAGGKELFRLESRTDGDGEPGARLVLRPEATASVVRAYFQGGLNQGPQPVRLVTLGPMFRHDKPQFGRYRQFYQFDVEVIGDPSPAYDAEVIELTWGWLAALGIGHVALELNSIGDRNCRPAYIERLKEYYRPLEEQLHPECQRRLEENPLRLLDCKEPQCQPFKAAAPRITDHLCAPCAAAFEEVKSLLDAAGLEYRLNPYLVRGLDYYTRTVFELQHEALGGAQNSLGGGGRYDGLAADLGYPDTPGVGFAGGIDRVVTMLQQELGRVAPAAAADLVVLPMDDSLDRAAAQVGRICREHLSVAVDYSRRSLKAKMRAADRSGARWAAIMNADEAGRRVVQLRDLVSGEQTEVSWDSLPAALRADPPQEIRTPPPRFPGDPGTAISWGPRGGPRMSAFTGPRAGSLRAGDVGREVELRGWVGRRRDHGGLIFVDLRDRWGAVQVVFNPATAPAAHAAASGLRAEYVVRVCGVVQRRPEGSENPHLPTGEVELHACELEVVNPSKPLPFVLDSEQEPDEAVRLKYRYLDLRRPRMQHILQVRHRVNQLTREYFDEQDFLEVETPILTKSTPEGARDFLVPSRLHQGKFYALPQSPQQMKQLLMVAGVQRYYQIARCLRDEDLRADRSAEFTQLDLEMSFAEEDDIFELIEGWIGRLWKQVLDVDLPRPWPRLTVNDALLRYGSDKPDLRYGLEIADLGEVLAGTRAQVFRGALDSGGVVRGLAVPGGRDMTRRELDELATLARGAGGRGLAWLPGGPLDKFLTGDELQGVLRATGAGEGDLVLVAADRRRRAEKVMGLIRAEVARRRRLVREGEWRFLWVYPMNLFEEGDDGNLTYGHHPFTRPMEEDMAFIDERPYDVRAHAYDFVCNGYELGGGSLRIHDRRLQERVFRLLGLPDETIQGRFGHLLEAFEYGVPPHGGIAPGLDRIVMMLVGTDNIRDVIAFPKTQSMVDLMMEAPSPVEDAQLRELGIQLRPATKS